jgi:hypothetical protein
MKVSEIGEFVLIDQVSGKNGESAREESTACRNFIIGIDCRPGALRPGGST